MQYSFAPSFNVFRNVDVDGDDCAMMPTRLPFYVIFGIAKTKEKEGKIFSDVTFFLVSDVMRTFDFEPSILNRKQPISKKHHSTSKHDRQFLIMTTDPRQ